ncbi:PHB depolymerase esterase [Duganella sp. Root198D2]|nr:PHB depolymerase esterase [Duganella sp. Root336D2]KRB92454.1 PHB depolymerase esterase [Duganella sp. Root198D2]
MNYWLYTPEQIPETVVRHGWPLIVMLHGCHQSATQLAKGTRMNHLAEGKGYAVLYPQQPLSMQAQRCWRWYSSSVQQGSDEAAALAGLIEKICTQYPINRSRIYACGISAGAGMAAILALNHPELIAAVGLHSSPVFGAASNAVDGLRVMRHGSATPAEGPIERILEHRRRPSLTGVALPMPLMPVLTIQGDDDKVVHPVNQQQLIRQWLRLNGMPHDTGAQRITIKPSLRGGSRNAHEIHDYLLGNKPVVRSVRISGLGHAWSGGDPSERFNAKAGPDAGRLIIDFFGKHRR